MAARHMMSRMISRIYRRRICPEELLRCSPMTTVRWYHVRWSLPDSLKGGTGPLRSSWGPPRQQRQISDIVPDLQRFLLEVGTDPREARYWLKQFTEISSHPTQPFAVVFVEDEVFSAVEQLETFASCISFLQRNNMKTVILIGRAANSKDKGVDQDSRKRSVVNTVQLTNLLERNGTWTRPLFPGSGIIQTSDEDLSSTAKLEVSPTLIQWCLAINFVPILSCYGETAKGHMFAPDEESLVLELSKVIEPLKVINVNMHGGFRDEKGRRIANIHLPADLGKDSQYPWCQEPIRRKMENMYTLLKHLPTESSAVITSPDTMLAELFSHRGSGTFFVIMEQIHVYENLRKVDEKELTKLFDNSFQKTLRRDYFDEIKSHLLKIFVSERYNAAAIILEDRKAGVPYLCKFAVSAKAQGAGTGENLWKMVKREFRQLFWRSRHNNPINPWYFKQSDGSWSGKRWTVFWYGIELPSMSAKLIDSALSRPASFLLEQHGVERKPGTGTESKAESPE